MAMDIGEKRIGIAISDASLRVATPLCVLQAEEVMNLAKPFKRVLEDWEPDLLLCGLPLTMSGEDGPQAERVRKIAQDISQNTGIEVEFTDERLSSAQAKRSLRESGYKERDMRGKIDMIAASLFLQAWLDSKEHSEKE